ncbi:MAG: peptidoglycan-binding domain-containing protein, partial [Devosia sp.]
MTAATLSRLPISAGGAAAASLARGVYWVLNRLIDLGYLVATQFMRAPVAISTIAAIVAFSLLAGGNALYFQSSRHPAPLFFAPPRHATPAPAAKPVIPAMRPRPVIDEETTGSLGTAPAADTIDNTDVLLLQRKLAALKFFDGTPDGIFGRRTASAIKTFEIKADLKPRGKLTRELLATVLAAPVPTAAEAPSTSTTVADVAAIAATKPAAARPASTTVTAGGAPVPLAPLPRTVSVIRVANTAPVVPVDTFSANSLPATDATPAASASAPAAAAPEPSVPAPQPLASAAPPATDPANDSSIVAMNNLPSEKATLPAAPAAAPITTQQVATAQASPASASPD